jgi:hypothetical protein
MTDVGLLGVDSGHRHILHGTCDLLDREDVDLTLFTTPDNRDGLEDRGLETNGMDVVLADEDESYRSFLRRVESRASARLDLLYVNTVGYRLGRYLSYIGFDPDCLLYARIYNARTWFDPSFETRDLQSVGYVNACHVLRRLLLRKLDGVVVEYPPMAEYIERTGGFDGDVRVIPVLYEVGERADQDMDSVRVVVPGNIQSHRRDYEFLLDAFKDAFERHGDSLSLDLLGRPRDEYGERIVDRCRSLESAGHDVTYHTEWIDDEAFEEGIAAADLICSPFRRQIDGPALNAEVYGRTKGSSVVGHAIRHAKLLVVPDWFRLAWDTAEYSLTFNDQSSLVDALSTVATGETDTDKLKKRAKAESERIWKETNDAVDAWFGTVS